MLISLPHRRVLSLPFIPLLTVFVVGQACFIVLFDLSATVLLFVALPLSLFAGLAVSFPWFLLLSREGENLLVHSLRRSARLRIPGSRYQLRDRRLWLCGSDEREGIALMPYPYERTQRVVELLHRLLGLPAELDVSFKASVSSMRRKNNFVFVCIFAGSILWLVYVARATCDPASDCSVYGIFSILLSGIRELFATF